MEPEKKEAGGFKFRYIFYITIIVLFLLAIFSYRASDSAVLDGGTMGPLANWIGPVGAHLSRTLFFLFGVSLYPIIFVFLCCIIRRFLPNPRLLHGYFWALFFTILGLSMLFALFPDSMPSIVIYLGLGSKESPELSLTGGTIGQFFCAPETASLPGGVLRRLIGLVGSLIVTLIFLCAGLIFLLICDWIPVLFGNVKFNLSIHREKEKKDDPFSSFGTPNPEQMPQPLPPETPMTEQESVPVTNPVENVLPESVRNPAVPLPEEAVQPEPEQEPVPVQTPAAAKTVPPPLSEIVDGKNGSNQRSGVTAAQFAGRDSSAETSIVSDYKLPPVTLFDEPKTVAAEDTAHLERSKNALQSTLDSFNVAGHVTRAVVGPRVTRFEIQLDPGVKVASVTTLENNIAMDMEAQSVRILAPIPGESAVGVEVPNKNSSVVYIRSLLESEEWTSMKGNASKIPIVLGRDVAGRAVITNLAKAPHLLIAGSTGSGKSVCMNTLIMSLLMKFSPYDLKLILVDPKHVELAMYKPLPHLITPVVNDPKQVPLALRWADAEMERRYRIMEAVKAKKLQEFNSRPKKETPDLDEYGNPIPDHIPLLIVIVDELADIMMTEAKKDVETYICRIAQKGRAAGIHLVIATQTPRKDVVTGLIKANLPTKIAFRVTSGIDSRVILDTVGAETLLGNGDMLFMAPGGEGLERVQGTLVSDPEIERVVNFVVPQVPQSFNSDVVAETEVVDSNEEPHSAQNYAKAAREAAADDAEHEESLQQFAPGLVRSVAAKYLKPSDNDIMRRAMEIILEEKRVSTSYLQRRLGIGYNKSAEIIDELERRGVVSAPLPGGQKRDILILDQLVETNNI